MYLILRDLTYRLMSKAEIEQMPSYAQYTDESIEEIFGIVGDEIVNKCKSDAEVATDFSIDAKYYASPIILNNSPSSEQLNKTTSLFEKLFKKYSIHDPKMQVRTMHTISSTLKSLISHRVI